MLASLLANIEDAIPIPEAPFKFQYFDVVRARRIKEMKDRKYYEAHGFGSFPDETELRTYFERLQAKIIIDHTPKNRFFASLLLDQGEIYIHIRRRFDTLCLSHRGVPWGTHIVSVLYCRWIFDWILSQYRRFAAKQNHNYFLVRYEDLLAGDHSELIDFFENLNLRIEKREPGVVEPKSVAMPAYTLLQHRKVGKALDVNQLHVFRDRKWDYFKIKVFLLSKFGPALLPLCLIIELPRIVLKLSQMARARKTSA